MSGLLPPNKVEQALINAARKGEEIDLARFSTDGSGKALIRAEFLRALILRKNGWEVHERGIHFRNARIRNQLDLSHCRIDFPLVMRDCEFGDTEEWETFCEKHKSDDEETYIENLDKISTLNIEASNINLIQLDGSIFHGALLAEWTNLETSLYMDNCVFRGPVHLSNINIKGHLSADSGKFLFQIGDALIVEGAEIMGTCFLCDAIFAAPCKMLGTKIRGQLVAEGTKFSAQKGYALNAQDSKVEGGVFFRYYNKKKTEFCGELCFVNAELGGLFMEGVILIAQLDGVALNATNCIIHGNCQLGSILDKNMDFIACGAIIFIRAKIKGKISLSGARLISQQIGKRTPIYPKMNDCMGFHLRRDDDRKKENSTITAFSFVEGEASRLVMPEKEAPRGVVDLTRAHVGTLKDFRQGWPGGDGNTVEEHLVLDGFTYDHLRNPAGYSEGNQTATAKDIANARKQWLLRQKPEHLNEHFRSQPWRQIIRVLRRDGMDDAALQLEANYRRCMRQTQIDFWSISRLAGWFIDLISHYGRRPWRALRISIFVIVIFTAFWAIAMSGCSLEGCRDESVFVRTKVAEYTRKPTTNKQEDGTYPDFNPLGFSFDVFIPLFNFGYQDTWAVNTSWHSLWKYKIPHPNCMTAGGRYANQKYCSSQENNYLWNFTISVGGLLYLAYLLEIFLGAILVAIAIAGFTGLIGRRREEE